MAWNVFVLGLDELGERLLPQLNHADDYVFHGLLSLDEAVHAENYDIARLLKTAIEELERFDGSVDAVVGYWDFPTSALAPLIRQHFNLPGPTLESVLKCENKYWSRLEQRKAAPDVVPQFQALDPFAEDPLQEVELDYPFWLKPIKSHSSQLGFRIDSDEQLQAAIPRIREGIERLAEPFNEVMAYADLPPEITSMDHKSCIAEGIISMGRQCTLEGYVFNGEVRISGIVDTLRDAKYPSVLSRYVYPSGLPQNVQDLMFRVTRAVMLQIGYDNAAFNIEYFYDEHAEKVWLLEINSRLSRSHGPIFQLVDGVPHFQIMVDLGLGIDPRMPHREGHYALAAKQMIKVFEDGIVRRVPSEHDIKALEALYPGTLVEMNVEEGMRLSELLHQDEYSYELGVIFTGADDQDQLSERLRQCEDMLDIRIDPVSD
ncbi:ATP-grasp domain-containing protein [Marinobacteraceae bacterium S3BR75-40.1]